MPAKTGIKRQLGLVFFFVFIDLLGYSLILPLLPYYAETFNANNIMIGLLGTVNAVGQMVAAPAIGRFSDRFGRRPMLIFSIAGTILSFLLLGFAGSLAMLFVSRVLDGVLGGNTALARAYITDITDEDNRSKSLGIIGAAFGIGFIIGPAMGGFLSKFGFSTPAFVAAGLSILNLILVILWLPESLPKEERQMLRKSPYTAFTAKLLIEELRRECTGPLLQMRLYFSLAFTLFTANFSLYAKTQLSLSAQTTSYLLTYVGIISVIVQGFLIGKLTAKFKEKMLIYFGSIVMGGSLLAWSFTRSVWLLLVVMAPLAVAAGVVNTLLTSQLTKNAYKEDIGGILGLGQSAQTFAQIISPILGGLLIETTGAWAVGVLAALLIIWSVIFMSQRYLPLPDICKSGYHHDEAGHIKPEALESYE
ncbi:MAG: MFS transporter [Anaerolineaceae bacterium]|nr:MFS transporter [Anaerolineaceae bacterium]